MTSHPDNLPANVVQLRPDGIYIRSEGGIHWVERRRSGHSVAAVAHDLGELYELRDVLCRYLEALDEEG